MEHNINVNCLPDSIEYLYIDKIVLNLELKNIQKLPSNLQVLESNDFNYNHITTPNAIKEKYSDLQSKYPNVQFLIEGS